jgi:hypothetical protein
LRPENGPLLTRWCVIDGRIHADQDARCSVSSITGGKWERTSGCDGVSF